METQQALRGIGLVGTVTIMTEIGDRRRFENPRQLMGYLGLVPGESVRRLGIAKAGNGRVRRALIEGAWSYRHLPRISPAKRYIHERVPLTVHDIAAKAQARPCACYRVLSGKGKS